MADIQHPASEPAPGPRRDPSDAEAAARRERAADVGPHAAADADATAQATDGHTTPAAGSNADLTDGLTATDGWEAGAMNPDALRP